MRVRCLAWLLIVLVVGACLDSLPDPPAIQSHVNESQVTLAFCCHGHTPIQGRWRSAFVLLDCTSVGFHSDQFSKMTVLPTN